MSSVSGISHAIATINKAINKKRATAICGRLAEMGADRARAIFSMADYDGINDITVSTKRVENGSAIEATGEAVLFVEFGSGVKYASEIHPQAEELGFGPGTWSEGPMGKGHWADPKGWTIPGTKQRSYGNPPALAMYEAGVVVKENLETAIKEEYGNV